jgi:hypothetical protein
MDGMHAPTPALPAHARRSRLSDTQKLWLGVAVAFVIASMAAGAWFSYWNLSAAAAAHGWHSPWLLPLMIDLGIPTYVIADHLLVALGWPSRLARIAAWGFAALTIFGNGAATLADSLLWVILAAACPTAWVLGIEVLRLIWKALRKPPPEPVDAIPLRRWMASPGPTFFMWRRKNLLGVTTWPLMNAIEDARVYLRDTVAAVLARKPGLPVPLSVATAMRTGRFPADVRQAIEDGLTWGGAAHWEPVLDSWLSRRLGLSEALSEAISNDLQTAPETVTQAAPELPAGDAPQTAPRKASATAPQKPPAGAVQKARRKGGRKATDEDIREGIRELFADRGKVSKYLVMKELPVGDKTAGRLLAEVQAERAPRPLHAVAEGG